MRVYSVTVEGEGDDRPTFFPSRVDAAAFEERHADGGIECGPVQTLNFPNAVALARYLNKNLGHGDE